MFSSLLISLNKMDHIIACSFVVLFSVVGHVIADVTCPLGWLAGDTSCYLFGHYNVSFVDAESFCRIHSAHLVQTETKHENDFIKDRLRAVKAPYWWLGITDEVIEGEWRWFQEKSLTNFTDWGPTEPQPERDEDCAAFSVYDDFAWVDVKCTSAFTPLCEKKYSYLGYKYTFNGIYSGLPLSKPEKYFGRFLGI